MFNFFPETINTQLGVILSGKHLQTSVMKQMESKPGKSIPIKILS